MLLTLIVSQVEDIEDDEIIVPTATAVSIAKVNLATGW
jgi:hypothetical protein